jgi:hypothetical protein
MLMGIDDLHLDIKREGIYTGILQSVKVFYISIPTNMWKTLTV